MSALPRFARRQLAAVALFLSVLAMPSVAEADPGKPVGWELSDATARLVVGRFDFYYDPSLHDEAMVLTEKLPQWWSDVEQQLAHDLDDTMTIHFVTHAGQVAEASEMPRWVNGVASPERGEIIVSYHTPDGAVNDYAGTLEHELIHVGLYRATAGHKLPRWFHEGVAESLSDEVSFQRAEALAAAVFGAGVPEIERFDLAFHGDQRLASVAYAAARDFVTFLRYRDVDGNQFKQLLTELRNGHGFAASVLRAYKMTLAELDQEWRSGLIGRFMWYPLLASGTLPFLLFVPVGTAAWIRRRRNYKKGLARLEAEDEALRLARAARAAAASRRMMR
jgi:hypothetical protein